MENFYEYFIMTSSTADKKYFRQLGHNLKPVVTIASKGFTESVQLEIERALDDHELIKLKLVTADRDSKKALTDEICRLHKAQLIQSIGHVVLILGQLLNQIQNFLMSCVRNTKTHFWSA